MEDTKTQGRNTNQRGRIGCTQARGQGTRTRQTQANKEVEQVGGMARGGTRMHHNQEWGEGQREQDRQQRTVGGTESNGNTKEGRKHMHKMKDLPPIAPDCPDHGWDGIRKGGMEFTLDTPPSSRDTREDGGNRPDPGRDKTGNM